MGFCDYVTLEKEHQEHGLAQGSTFQSKTLCAWGGEFTLTAEGRLVEHRYRYEADPERTHPVGG